MAKKEKYYFGWAGPSSPDFRDLKFMYPYELGKAIPNEVDMSSSMPPVYDQGNLGSCFPAGTLIRMADGSERPIEDIRLGESVVTAEGRTGKVNRLMLREEKSELMKVSLRGYSALRCTPEHPVLTKRGYVRADRLRFTDFVALTKYRPHAVLTHVHVTPLVTKKEMTLKSGFRKFGVIHGRADTATVVAQLPDLIELTSKFGRLVGLFLAEGSTDSGKSRWTFGSHEEKTLVAETVGLLADLGIEANVQKRPNNSINVVCYGTAWARLWEKLCGNGCGLKRLHGCLFSGPDDFLRGVLEGWLAGDGYSCKRTDGTVARRQGKTVSKQLAMGMYDIAQHLGLRPAIRYEIPKINPNEKAKSRRIIYMVDLSAKGDNWRCVTTKRHVWRKVRALAHEPWHGPVYNMSVEGDNSYVAQGIGVHNCGLQSVGAIIEYREKKQGFTDAQTPSRLQMYYDTRVLMGTVNQDSGVTNRQMMKAIAANGYCEEKEFWPYVISKFKQKPPQPAYDDAKKSKDIKYRKVAQSVEAMCQCLADGNPIITGFSVYPSFMNAPEGDAQFPSQAEINQGPVGGHDVVAVGYSLEVQRFYIRNSWGTRWGRGGYGSLPFNFLNNPNFGGDYWTVDFVPADSPEPPPGPSPTPSPIDWKLILQIIKMIIDALIGGNKNKLASAVSKLRDAGADEATVAVILEYARGMAKRRN